MDVAGILAEESKIRTALFAVLANYGTDETSCTLLLHYLDTVR